MGKIRGTHSSPGIYYKNNDIEYGYIEENKHVSKTVSKTSYSSSSFGNGILKLDKTGNVISVIYFGTDDIKQVLSVEKYVSVVFETKEGVESYIAIPSAYEVTYIYSIPDEKDIKNSVLVYDYENPSLETLAFQKENDVKEISGINYTIYKLINDTVLDSKTKYKIKLIKI